MNFPPPSEKQARLLWISVTALSIGILLALIGLLLWGFGWVVNRLSAVLLPLAVAGVLACLLDPLVDLLERKRIPRAWAILLVFLLGLMVVGGALGIVVPKLVEQTRDLIQKSPEYAEKLQKKVSEWMRQPPMGLKFDFPWKPHGGTNELPAEATNQVATTAPAQAESGAVTNQAPASEEPIPSKTSLKTVLGSETGAKIIDWLTATLPKAGSWLLDKLSQAASWFGLLVGLALVPVYVFYFLLEKKGIQEKWTEYLPLYESSAKDEAVFIIGEINERLITFFRGQVLVAMCIGILLTIGFLAIGLNYALLIGLLAGVLSIVPYLGAILTIVPAVILAIVQFQDWLHPLLVVAVFSMVQMLEGLVISPKIMGDRVGLHPVTIIIAVLVGTTLMGGILGGVLAIPLTAVLRTLMFRYIWIKRGERPGTGERKQKQSRAKQ